MSEFWLVVPQGDPNPNPYSPTPTLTLTLPLPLPLPLPLNETPNQATIQDCRVVTAQETASAKCFLKLHWIDAAFPDKIRAEQRTLIKSLEPAQQTKDLDLEKMAVDLEAGELVYGMLDAAPDSFPINIDSIFSNQISAERIGGLCWTKYDEDTGVVSVSGCAVEPIPCGSK